MSVDDNSNVAIWVTLGTVRQPSKTWPMPLTFTGSWLQGLSSQCRGKVNVEKLQIVSAPAGQHGIVMQLIYVEKHKQIFAACLDGCLKM